MNILMLGGSWAVPNYPKNNGFMPEQHLEFLLRDQGHSVHNCAWNCASNLETLKRGIDYIHGKPVAHPSSYGAPSDPWWSWQQLDEPIKFDWIIWFHTDLSRDMDKIDHINLSVTEMIESLTHVVYSRYKAFFNYIKARTVVVGSFADIHPNLYNYITPDYCVPSWQQELLGPGVSAKCLEIKRLFRDASDHPDFKHELLDEANQVWKAMMASGDFPDDCHPGPGPHRDLANQLIELFEGRNPRPHIYVTSSINDISHGPSTGQRHYQ